MKSFWKTVGAVVIGCFVFGLVESIIFMLTLSALIASLSTAETENVLEENSVYQLKLEGVVVDYNPNEDMPDFSSLYSTSYFSSNEKLSLSDIRRTLKTAAEDKNCKALYLDCGTLAASPASIEEIRHYILKFKESKKPVIAYADYYSQGTYWIAALADHLYINPQGTVTLSGITFNTMFLKGTLDKLGVEMQIFKVGTFKSAVEPYIMDKMSDANRLQMQRMADVIWNKILTDISADRKLEKDSLQAFADRGLFFDDAQVLVDRQMADSLVYRQDMDSVIRRWIGDEPEMVKLAAMKKVRSNENTSLNEVAVLYAMGDIDGGTTDGIDSEKLIKQINKLADDDDVKAVVLRINSPGGSAYGSEQLWYAEKKLKAKKPLIISMGDYAASGGYYMSCIGDTIVAYPTTLTGSIGIFGMMPCVKGLTEKVGVTFDGVKTAEFADFGSVYRPFTESEKILMQREINRGYELFTGRCATSRNLPQDSIKVIGEGRVWMGSDAINLGLVDCLGGLDEAIAIAAKRAGLTDNYEVTEYPEKKDFTETLIKILNDEDDDEEKVITRTLGVDAQWYRHYKALKAKSGVQAYMPYWIQL